MSRFDDPRVPDLSSVSAYQFLGVLLVCGLVLRLILFDAVSVNYDTGFYLYDAYRILDGGVPMVDYYSRSPLFHYILAGGLLVLEKPLVVGRLSMIIASLAVGIGVYVLTAKLRSQSAGLFAAALYLMTPLTLIWGQWLKTEQVAAFVGVLALIVLLPRFDAEEIQFRHGALFGGILGLGFLIRRILIVHAVLVVAFLISYRYATYQERFRPLILAGVAGGGMLSVIVGGYFVLARGDVGTVIYLIDTHLLGILPLEVELGASTGGPIDAALLDPLLLFCTNCSMRTINVTTETAIVTFPVLVFGWAYIRDVISQTYENDALKIAQTGTFALAVTLLGLIVFNHPATFADMLIGMYALFAAVLGWLLVSKLRAVVGFHVPAWLQFESEQTVFSLEVVAILFVVFAWFGLAVGRLQAYRVLYPLLLIGGFAGGTGIVLYCYYSIPRHDAPMRESPGLAVVLVLAFGIWLSYLVRDRVIFIGYFQDSMPFVAIIAGVAVDHIHCRLEERDIRRYLLIGGIGLVMISSLIAAPYIQAGRGGIEQPYGGYGQTTTIDAIGDDIHERTAHNETIFTAQPLYALAAERGNAADFSRMYWYFLEHPDSRASNVTAEQLIGELRAGTVGYVIVERRLDTAFSQRPDVEAAFDEHFCPIKTPGVAYDRVGADLYVRNESAPACSS